MLFVNVLKKNADAELAFLKSYYLFLFYYLVRTTFLFCRSIFLFYYLVRTTFFLFCMSFFFSAISCARLFSHVVFFFYCLVWTTYWFIFWWKATFTPDSRPNPDKCRSIFMAWSVWSGKKLPALIEERIRGLSQTFVDNINRHLTFFNENKELKPISRYTSINMRGLSGKSLESIQKYWNHSIFLTPGMQRRGTLRHLCIYTYIAAYLVIILESRVCCSDILSFSITFPQKFQTIL